MSDLLSSLFGGAGRGLRRARQAGGRARLGYPGGRDPVLRRLAEGGHRARAGRQAGHVRAPATAAARSPAPRPKSARNARAAACKAQNQGLFALSQPCPRCGGNGTIIEQPCAQCGGTGVLRQTRRYTVKVPAGARDGTKIRIKGRGEAGTPRWARRRPVRRRPRAREPTVHPPRRRSPDRAAGDLRRGRHGRQRARAHTRRRHGVAEGPGRQRGTAGRCAWPARAPLTSREAGRATCWPACA